MRHGVKTKKLGRTKEHRMALRYNLLRSFIIHKKIITTSAKAKFCLPFIEKAINLAKNSDLATYKRLIAYLRNDIETAKELVSIGEEMKNRKGGYVEKVKLNDRKGDGATQVLLRLMQN